MCGIIGYVGSRQASHILIEGLRRLEYRGYDSAGIAVLNGKGVVIRRVEGKLAGLEALLLQEPISGSMGIGHTRWATHGRPSEINAHPHRFQEVVVVHNGIIENHNELKRQLAQKGHQFTSETDSEVICHLVSQSFRESGNSLAAFQHALEQVRGSYALAVMFETDPHQFYVARKGSPLVIGATDQETFVASDVSAILPYTREVFFLEDGDVGVVRADKVELFSQKGEPIERKKEHIHWSPQMAERGGYKHFMLKEIFEQPIVFEDTISGRISVEKGAVHLQELDALCRDKEFPFDEIVIIACGTSLHAGMVAKYLLESLAAIRTNVELASEFRYRHPIIRSRSLVVPITQSGETADTIAATKLMVDAGATILPICNAVGSSITRLAKETLYTYAGPEIGVASTKAFTAQLMSLVLLALDIAQRKKVIESPQLALLVKEIFHLPRAMKTLLAQQQAIQSIAQHYSNATHALFIGRGLQYPMALEGALKLKEISYLHAEGFAAGELKHGPIALIDKGVPVIAMVLQDEVHEKMRSNIEEVQARGAHVIALITEGDEETKASVEHAIEIPKASPFLAPLLTAIPLQLFSYYVADHRGTDIDQPRNLAKSVTVE